MEAARLPQPTQLNLPAFPQLAFSCLHCKEVQWLPKTLYLRTAFTCCFAEPLKAQCCARDTPHEWACRKHAGKPSWAGVVQPPFLLQIPL